MSTGKIPGFKLTESDSAMDIWPGVAPLERAGVELAVEMLVELEQTEPEKGEEFTACEQAEVEDWPRQGTPFRNIVAEYLERARAAGAEAEAGFCGVLSDIVSNTCQGVDRGNWAGQYAEMYGIDVGDDDEEEEED